MPSLSLSRSPKPDAATLYVCIGSHVSKAGSYTEGQKLRGDHPGVQATPSHWARADLDSESLFAAGHALRFLGTVTPPAPPQTRLAREIPLERQVRCIRGVAFGGVHVQAGQIFDKDDAGLREMRKHFPVHFEPVGAGA
jgi:hypothetical protein